MHELQGAGGELVRKVYSDRVAYACASSFSALDEPAFVEKFLERANHFGIRKKELSDICFTFCEQIARLARDGR